MRPLQSWPTMLLRIALRLKAMRGIWAEAFIELHHREVVEPTLATANKKTGPWLVAPPPGMH